jgi:hypothetical protein
MIIIVSVQFTDNQFIDILILYIRNSTNIYIYKLRNFYCI